MKGDPRELTMQKAILTAEELRSLLLLAIDGVGAYSARRNEKAQLIRRLAEQHAIELPEDAMEFLDRDRI